MNRNQVLVFTAVLFFAAENFASAQVVINEIQSSNFSTIQDEDGQYEDWVELYNSGNAAVNLAGYGLSDNPDKPYKFAFPSYSLPAHDHLLIFANDTNETFIGSHWESAVRPDHTWKYRANTTIPPDTNWRNLSFNDASWSSGTGGIGNGDADDATVIPLCASYYMRKTFSIPDTSKIFDAIFNIDYDDGFVAFLNGTEIARANIGVPGDRPLWNAFTYAGYEAQMYQGMPCDSFHIDAERLHALIKNGTNVLAIEVHNQNSTSTDLTSIPVLSFKIKDASVIFSPVPSWFPSTQHPKDYFHAAFKISKTGETIYLTSPMGLVLDEIPVPSLEFDNSFGRSADGSATWKYFEVTTPDTTNSLSTAQNGYCTIPLFSLQGGFYTGTQTLTITTTFPGGVIRYTTNGDLPKATSTLYTAPISISSTKTIRARVFSATNLPGAAITNTYFINVSCKLPVYSLALDSADLWDYNKGIFVKGPNASPNAPYFGANYWQDWEKYVSMEFYDKQKNKAFKTNAGVSITGGWSRRYDQKSLEVRLGDKYGLSKIQYQIIPDKKWLDKWDDFLLHTSGNDRGYAHMRDPVMERLMKGTHSDYTAYEPCLLYINGVQWGVYYSKENDDQNFIKANYGFGKSETDLLKESYFFPDIEVKSGDEVAFRTMYSYAMNTAPSSSPFYAAMDSMMDLKNQVDYFAAECYYPNDDWMGGSNNNLKLWRPREDGGRFRYLLYDLDFGFGMYGNVSDDILAMAMNANPHNYNSEIFARLLLNPQYKNYFINRYADLINTIWLPSNVLSVVNNFKDSMRFDMHFQFEKWGNGDSNTWKANIDNVLNFSIARPAYARGQVLSDLGMTGQVTLTLQASPAGSGRIQISTITPQTLPWSGVYFNGNPVTVTAIPNPGFTFDHWHSNLAIPVNDTNQSVTRNFSADDVITAYFTGSPVNPAITISEINYNSDSAINAGDWIELHNLSNVTLDLSGWKIRDDNDHHEFLFPVSTRLAANGYLVIAEDLEKFHAQHPAVTNVIGETGFNLSDGGDQIRLFKCNDSLFLSMEYSDQDPWSAATDGDGYTLEQLLSSGDLNDGNNWFAGCLGGSPGTGFTAPVASFVLSGPAAVCSDDSLMLSASTATGNQYQWQLNNVQISGATNSTFHPSQTGKYSVVVTNNGCESISDSVLLTITPRAADPVTTSASRCGNGQVTLSAASADTIYWYNFQHQLVGSGNTFQTPALSQDIIYFVQSNQLCPSQFIADTITINSIPADPVTTGQSVCGHGIMTLTASSNQPVKWYDAPNGNLVASGNSLVTPDLYQSKIFYAQSGDICLSAFVSSSAVVNPISADPVTNSVSRCDTGTITLYASAADSIRWFDAPNGTLLSSGTSFQTPVLSNSMTYYVQSGTVCPSNFVSVQAIISATTPDPVIPDQSRCGNGSVVLTATATDTVRWYDTPNGNLMHTGNIFTTPPLNLSTTYYAVAGSACASDIVAAEAVIHPVAGDPIATPAARCGTGSVTLSALSSDTVRWYDAPGGSLLYTGTSFITPSLSQTTNYYLQAGTTCPGNFVSVTATVNAIPSDPVTSLQSRCGSGSLNLTAAGADTIRWYDNVNGNLLSEGTQFITPVLNQSTTYYVRAEGICVGSFVPAQAVVIAVPADPVTADQSRCGEGTVVLTAAGPDTIRWYDAPHGNMLGTGMNFTTPSLASTTNFFIRAENICQSNFVSVQVVIHPIPPDPVTTGEARCGQGSVTLSASGQDTLRWYDAPNGNLVAEGSIYLTPILAQSTTYVVRTESVCESGFTSVQATVTPTPPDPLVASGSTCGIGTVVLTATSTDTVYWYDLPHGNLLGTGYTFQTPVMATTSTFFAEASNGCEGNFVPVNAYVFDIPQFALGNDTIIESGSTVILDAGPGFTNYLWNNGETTQTTSANSTGNYWVTVTDVNGCSASDTMQVLVTVNVQPYMLTEGVLIYPNPTHSSLSISFKNDENEDIFLRLIDNNGKLVWNDFSVNEKRVMRSIGLDQYARGLYLFQIATSKTKREFKVVLK